MNIRSTLSPEGSVVSGLAVAGSVYAIYQLDIGPVSQAAASDANHPVLESSRKKAGYTAFVLVAGMTIISKDANVGILGFASIIAMEAHYRHAIMADPATGIIQPPAGTAYQPAGNVVPFAQQGQAVG
jgi:hypothetical protein